VFLLRDCPLPLFASLGVVKASELRLNSDRLRQAQCEWFSWDAQSHATVIEDGQAVRQDAAGNWDRQGC
jgi:hypothetical protein